MLFMADEEREILNFLSANGIETLERLKHYFSKFKKDEDVQFVNEVKSEDRKKTITAHAEEESDRNKEIMLKQYEEAEQQAATLNPQKQEVQQRPIPSNSVAVATASSAAKPEPTMPMRYVYVVTFLSIPLGTHRCDIF